MPLVHRFLVCLAIGLVAANEQKVVQDNWVHDKRDNSSIEINGSRLNRLTATFEFDISSFNALYLGIVANETNKRFYWEFNCVSNCESVGVAKMENYDPVYGIQGDSNLFVSDFGDYIEDGDRIGFILDAGEQELKIYLVQNDRPLGLAYIQNAPYSNELYPFVRFRFSPGVVEINEKKNVNTDHLLVRGDYPEKGIQGDYKLVKVNGTVPEMEGYFLRLGKPEREGNEIWARLYFIDHEKFRGDIVKVGKDAEGDLYKYVKPVRIWEKQVMGRASMDFWTISTSIENLKRMKFSDHFDQLTIIATDPDTTLLFKRFVFERPSFNLSSNPETSHLLA